MPLVSVADVRAVVSTSLDDDNLSAIIAREEAQIVAKFGAHGDGETEVTETIPRVNGVAFLSREPAAITSVAEAAYPGATAATLDDSAYHAWLNESRIQFYPGGTLLTPADDRTVVTVVYVPKDDRDERGAVLIELVRIAVTRRAEHSRTATAEGAGRVSLTQTFVDFEKERARLYRRLAPVGF